VKCGSQSNCSAVCIAYARAAERSCASIRQREHKKGNTDARPEGFARKRNGPQVPSNEQGKGLENHNPTEQRTIEQH
jgi:hypothetical protein